MNNEEIEQVDDVSYHFYCSECETGFEVMEKDITVSSDKDEEGNERKYMTAKHDCGNNARIPIS
jgi:hypothetical protein